ncbi:MAG: HEAT repeat domain-containing protein [Deltaproteobacteria bacterium]|nr:HEAT repeat domain-containing protein [Deltaproteobacteria bacterium]
MGFLDAFFGPEKQILSRSRKVADIFAQPEDREAAARWLADEGSESALLGLLGRFDVTIENSMKDAAEKEMVADLLVGIGAAVLDPARRYVKRCKHIAWPLRVIEAIGGTAEALESVLEMLDEEVCREDFKPDRKRNLLVKIADWRDPRIVPSAVRFLADFDEGVRYAAVEAVLSQGSTEGREDLLAALANPREESNRLRARIADAFATRGWTLGERVQEIAARPPAGWTVRGHALVRAAPTG